MNPGCPSKHQCQRWVLSWWGGGLEREGQAGRRVDAETLDGPAGTGQDEDAMGSPLLGCGGWQE